jgi:hypothetical protein
MRSALVFLMTALSIESAPLSASSRCVESRPAVTVQIHDYSRVKPKSMTKAQEIASGVYKRVGIGVEWLAVISQNDGDTRNAGASEEPRSPASQLTINIVTSSMAKRMGYGSDVIGFVTVPPQGGMGRVGYVVYDRIKDVAAGAPTSSSDILGLIIAHDIGRLLLGAGSGTSSGVMNRLWQREALGRVDPLALGFSPPEVERLQATIVRDTASFPVGTAGSDSSECLATRDEAETTSSRTPSPAPRSSPGRR